MTIDTRGGPGLQEGRGRLGGQGRSRRSQNGDSGGKETHVVARPAEVTKRRPPLQIPPHQVGGGGGSKTENSGQKGACHQRSGWDVRGHKAYGVGGNSRESKSSGFLKGVGS